MQYNVYIYFKLVYTSKCIYMVAYGHIYPYMHNFGSR